MLTLKIQNVNKLFSKENYTGKKIIDPEADDLILEEAQKRKDYTQIKISVIVQETFAPIEEEHLKNKFKEYYIHKVVELTKIGKRQDRKYMYELQKGLLILIVFLTIGYFISRLNSYFTAIIGEIALIAGWVTIWKPFDYFIYTRHEHNSLIKVCENLTKVDVELIHESENIKADVKNFS